ncbi:SapC family protein [Marinobacterium sp. AK62]|uniref:SapC family protein n=1 Tax=Marinobacterium alkalitolerans TaxID=1542925 RepID=A0ABS3ZDE8_9GAMM|nr:SapC family protein [Marinobacterium alkalitolerans]MBP0049731.1 SapC family protein [Marinobacterium alkalitolerans]
MPENNKPNPGRVEVLSLERHRHLKFHVANNFAFAADWLFVPVHYKEVGRLSRHFPVLFYQLPDGGVMPCMLLKSNHASAIGVQMNWQGSALPDVLRLYPFGFIRQQGKASLAVYPDAPHFAGSGEKIITSKGKPTQRLRTIMQHLQPIERAFEQTAPLMQELQTLEVLEPITLNFKSGAGSLKQAQFLVCTDLSKLSQKTLSAELGTILHDHHSSCLGLLRGSGVGSSGRSDQDASDPRLTQTLQGLVHEVCERFDVTLDGLRSRKRSDEIMAARKELASRAKEHQLLSELPKLLDRSPDTVKKWSRG